MASFFCHGFGVTKQVRLERIVRRQALVRNDLIACAWWERMHDHNYPIYQRLLKVLQSALRLCQVVACYPVDLIDGIRLPASVPDLSCCNGDCLSLRLRRCCVHVDMCTAELQELVGSGE